MEGHTGAELGLTGVTLQIPLHDRTDLTELVIVPQFKVGHFKVHEVTKAHLFRRPRIVEQCRTKADHLGIPPLGIRGGDSPQSVGIVLASDLPCDLDEQRDIQLIPPRRVEIPLGGAGA